MDTWLDMDHLTNLSYVKKKKIKEKKGRKKKGINERECENRERGRKPPTSLYDLQRSVDRLPTGPCRSARREVCVGT